MKRKALIIGSPDKGIHFLPGVEKDVKSWEAYLSSPIGGAWDNDEIEVIESPTTASLKLAIRLLAYVDYSFVTFSGHGRSIPYGSTIININPSEEIDTQNLISNSKKQTIILDCCRTFPRMVLKEEARILSKAMDSYQDRNRYRLAFENHLNQCEPGQIILYSCSPNESAGESDLYGGYYTNAIQRASHHLSERQNNVLTVKQAHEVAKSTVESRTANKQHPVGEFPRSWNSFPFAVNP